MRFKSCMTMLVTVDTLGEAVDLLCPMEKERRRSQHENDSSTVVFSLSAAYDCELVWM